MKCAKIVNRALKKWKCKLRLRCMHCQFEWSYRGHMTTMVRCPGCGKLIEIQKSKIFTR